MGTPRIRRLDFRAEQTWCAVASKNVTGTAIDSLIVLKADRCVCVCVKAPFCELTGLETWGLWKGHCLLLGLTPHSAALLALAELGSWKQRPSGLQTPEYLLSGPLQKKFSNPGSRSMEQSPEMDPQIRGERKGSSASDWVSVWKEVNLDSYRTPCAKINPK